MDNNAILARQRLIRQKYAEERRQKLGEDELAKKLVLLDIEDSRIGWKDAAERSKFNRSTKPTPPLPGTLLADSEKRVKAQQASLALVKPQKQELKPQPRKIHHSDHVASHNPLGQAPGEIERQRRMAKERKAANAVTYSEALEKNAAILTAESEQNKDKWNEAVKVKRKGKRSKPRMISRLEMAEKGCQRI